MWIVTKKLSMCVCVSIYICTVELEFIRETRPNHTLVCQIMRYVTFFFILLSVYLMHRIGITIPIPRHHQLPLSAMPPRFAYLLNSARRLHPHLRPNK